MSRIYWDTMLFVYLLEEHPQYNARVKHIWTRMKERRDELCTSSLTLGEVLVAPYKQGLPERAERVESFFTKSVNVLPFTVEAAQHFARIRATLRVKPADAIHLACAAHAGMDLYITHDTLLIGKVIPGIQFIAGLNTDLL